MWVSKAAAASFTLDYEVLDLTDDGGRIVYVTAQTVLVPVTLEDARPRRLRPHERDVLATLGDE